MHPRGPSISAIAEALKPAGHYEYTSTPALGPTLRPAFKVRRASANSQKTLLPSFEQAALQAQKGRSRRSLRHSMHLPDAAPAVHSIWSQDAPPVARTHELILKQREVDRPATRSRLPKMASR